MLLSCSAGIIYLRRFSDQTVPYLKSAEGGWRVGDLLCELDAPHQDYLLVPVADPGVVRWVRSNPPS